MSELAIIQKTETSPEIRYVQPAEIVIVGYDDIVKAIGADLARYFPDGIDKHISEEDISKLSRDDIKVLKNMRTSLNKKKTSIDQKRKDVKNAILEPVKPFEIEMNALRDTYVDAAKVLGDVVERAESIQKAELRQRLVDHWEGSSIIAFGISFEAIEDPKWLNASFGEKKATAAIDERIAQIAGDFEAIEEMANADDIRAVYVRTLNLSESIAEVKRRMEEAARAAAIQAERNAIIAEREAQQAAEKPAEPVPAPQPAQAEQPMPHEHSGFTLRFEGLVSDLDKFKVEFKALAEKRNITVIQKEKCTCQK